MESIFSSFTGCGVRECESTKSFDTDDTGEWLTCFTTLGCHR